MASIQQPIPLGRKQARASAPFTDCSFDGYGREMARRACESYDREGFTDEQVFLLLSEMHHTLMRSWKSGALWSYLDAFDEHGEEHYAAVILWPVFLRCFRGVKEAHVPGVVPTEEVWRGMDRSFQHWLKAELEGTASCALQIYGTMENLVKTEIK